MSRSGLVWVEGERSIRVDGNYRLTEASAVLLRGSPPLSEPGQLHRPLPSPIHCAVQLLSGCGAASPVAARTAPRSSCVTGVPRPAASLSMGLTPAASILDLFNRETQFL